MIPLAIYGLGAAGLALLLVTPRGTAAVPDPTVPNGPVPFAPNNGPLQQATQGAVNAGNAGGAGAAAAAAAANPFAGAAAQGEGVATFAGAPAPFRPFRPTGPAYARSRFPYGYR